LVTQLTVQAVQSVLHRHAKVAAVKICVVLATAQGHSHLEVPLPLAQQMLI
jgi:hypothetical protein